MSLLPITIEPHPLLHQKCKKVKNFSDDLKKLADNMVETMREHYGVGLAAPQIGKDIQIITIEFDPKRFTIPENSKESYTETGREGSEIDRTTPAIPLTILVNPKIISHSKKSNIETEGCLSIPNTIIPVERFSEIKVLAQDLNGNRIKIRAKDYFARILQHEIDHLNGILITDREIK